VEEAVVDVMVRGGRGSSGCGEGSGERWCL
jgi:hypothetical protein